MVRGGKEEEEEVGEKRIGQEVIGKGGEEGLEEGRRELDGTGLREAVVKGGKMESTVS